MKELDDLQTSEEAFSRFIRPFRRFLDYILPNKRVILCGFGNHGDDDIMFKRWFSENTEAWEYGKIFYPLSMDLMGASSVCMADVVSNVGGIDLAWAAGVALRYVDLTKMNDPMYRIDTMIKLYRSRFSPNLNIHTIRMMDGNIFKYSSKLTNLRRGNI